jgi:hypothetical protein
MSVNNFTWGTSGGELYTGNIRKRNLFVRFISETKNVIVPSNVLQFIIGVSKSKGLLEVKS